MYDPNESSAVNLLTSDDKYAVGGVDFSPNQPLLCRKYLVEETCDHPPGNEKDQLSPICRYGTWRLQTLPYDDTQSQHENGGKPRKGTQQRVNEFYQLAAKNVNINAVQRSIASVI